MSLANGRGSRMSKPSSISSLPVFATARFEPSSHESAYAPGVQPFEPDGFTIIGTAGPENVDAALARRGSKYSMPSHILSSGRGKMW